MRGPENRPETTAHLRVRLRVHLDLVKNDRLVLVRSRITKGKSVALLSVILFQLPSRIEHENHRKDLSQSLGK